MHGCSKHQGDRVLLPHAVNQIERVVISGDADAEHQSTPHRHGVIEGVVDNDGVDNRLMISRAEHDIEQRGSEVFQNSPETCSRPHRH